MAASDGGATVRKVLGMGYWVQGFRCLPWIVVTFFLKDGLNADPSTLQLLQNAANLPMVAKPLYGLLSDVVYISDQHRIPYIAFGAFLQALSWLGIAIISPSSISITTISICMLLSNLGASIAEVANDAVVAEIGKHSAKSSDGSGELQSFVWIASSAGGILGNLLGGIAIGRFSPQTTFLFIGFLLLIQFFLTITVPESSLNLPKTSSKVGIKQQLSELSNALRKPEIARSIAWFGASYATIPVLTGTMFFYQTEHLKIDSSILGFSKVYGQVAMLHWSIIYNRYLKSVPARRIISAIQILMAMLMISDVLFVNGVYREMGLSDSVYVVFFSGLLEVLFFFKILPFSVVIAGMCPSGCEGSLIAFVMSAIALAFIVSGCFGVAMAAYVGISATDFSSLPFALFIQAVFTVLPLLWSSCIPDDVKAKARKKEQKSKRS